MQKHNSKTKSHGLKHGAKPGKNLGNPIDGTPGDDLLEVTGNNLRVTSGAGNDIILSNVGAFQQAIEGYPYYRGRAIVFYDGVAPTSATTVGTSRIDAGIGNDYVAVINGDYIVDLGDGDNTFDGGSSTGKLRITAGNGDDVIDAGGIGGERQINAGGGSNWIYLASGKAVVSAGAGDDVVMTSFPGTTSLRIYLGLDEFLPEYAGVLGKPYKQSIEVGDGNNQVALPVFGETAVTAGSGNDFVLLASVTRALLGGPPNEDGGTIVTNGGDDTVITLSMKSSIKAGSGNDKIYAGLGDDKIYAGSGNDLINLRGATISLPQPLDSFSFVATGPNLAVQGGGNDVVDLGSGQDTVVLGNAGFARIQGFGADDRLDVTGLGASFTRSGGNTLITAGGQQIGVLQGYTGHVGLV